MTKGELYRGNDAVVKILSLEGDEIFVIDCKGTKMPKWMDAEELNGAVPVGVDALQPARKASELSDKELAVARKRYSMIAGILPCVSDDNMRNRLITRYCVYYQVSRRTITGYLCKFLVYEDIGVLADRLKVQKKKPLTKEQKNMRWAINKFYYTRRKNPLTYAYIELLKAKYCDSDGKLLEGYPTMSQFRYFFQKTRKRQTEIISREGIKEYQLNHRPLLGDGVQEMATSIGWGMLDGTVCDIYLVDESGHLVGRPVLQVCVDAYEGLCCGYSLLWEGGVYSVRELMLNTVTEKAGHCKKFGITITPEQWPCHQLPGVIVTDRGSEFISYNFEQITELGSQLVSLSSFSANMKGPVEKLFDLVQEAYKPYLKGKGVIEPDFQKRGAVDYRKQASLTMEQFEKIVIRCIIFHNCKRILENFPFTERMVEAKVRPYASDIWNYCLSHAGANLISVTKEQLILTLLPRTKGQFSRKGLKVNGMRYKCDGYTEQYLAGGAVTVAYNPDDVSEVYLVKDNYRKFELIERRYQGKTLTDVESEKTKQSGHVKSFSHEQLQAKIDLANSIEVIASHGKYSGDVQMKSVRTTRKKERIARHRDLIQEVMKDDN